MLGFLLRIVFRVQIGFGCVDAFLMFAVRFVFGIIASALGFLMLGVFAIFFVVEMLVCLVGFFFLFVEGCAISQGVGVGTRLCFLVLRFDHVGGKRGELLLIERGRAIVSGKRGCCSLRMFLSGSRDRLGDFGSSNFLGRGLRRIGLGVGEDPMGQAAGETAAYTGTGLGQTDGRAPRRLLEGRLPFFGLLFPHGFYGRRNGTAAIFGQGFAGENDIVLGLVHGSDGDTVAGTTVIVAAGIAVTLRRCIF